MEIVYQAGFSLIPNKIYISLPKQIISGKYAFWDCIGSNYDLIVKLTDTNGLFTDYRLNVEINNAQLKLNTISDINLVSPQHLVYSYDQILTNKYNYDLNSSISLVISEQASLPYWITENSSEYKWMISTSFNPDNKITYHLRFKVTDYWGDSVLTNEFKLNVLKNNPPIVNQAPENKTFYKGQEYSSISLPENMFVDPGDTVDIYTSFWIEGDSKSLNTYFNQSSNLILIDYQKSFIGTWTIVIAAKDSASNVALTSFQIVVEGKSSTLLLSLRKQIVKKLWMQE